jgi:hypothetical protein
MQEVLYGVRATTLVDATTLVANTISEKPIACYNGDYGSYSRFGDYMQEHIKVIQNEDMYDGEPAVGGADEWKFVILLQRARDDSQFLIALDARPKSFVKLKSTMY